MKADFLKKRAEEFLKAANYSFKEGDFNIAAFDLEQAYLTSRYLPIEFSKYQIENMLAFIKELVSFLKKL